MENSQYLHGEVNEVNDAEEESAHNVEDKDLLHSGSTSPSESSFSVKSIENTNLGQILTPTLAALAAASATTPSALTATTTINRIDALEHTVALSPAPLSHTITEPSSAATLAPLSSSSSSSLLPASFLTSSTIPGSSSGCNTDNSYPAASVETIVGSASVPSTTPYVATLSSALSRAKSVDSQIQPKHKTTITPSSPPVNITEASEFYPPVVSDSIDSSNSACASTSNLIDSHDDLEQSIPAIRIHHQQQHQQQTPSFVDSQQTRYREEHPRERLGPSAER
ncbi:unnamed protein product [Hermetia illucens]|uniref:Uncharacterized protein n=1 Tax=Hermetia illucens TaxID=343691 RepID=A0A7R8USF2_HERIL|nr:unnamed protein product [Hermetia illucens]